MSDFLELQDIVGNPLFILPREVIAVENADTLEYDDYYLKWGLFLAYRGTIPSEKRTKLTLDNGVQLYVKGDAPDIRQQIEIAREGLY